MGLRAYIVLAISLGGCVISFRRPYYGLLLISFFYFFRPSLWGAEQTVQPVLWLTICSLIGWIVSEDKHKPFHNFEWFILFTIFAFISSKLAPHANALTLYNTEQLTKIFIFIFLIINICNTPKRIAGFIISIILGNIWFMKVVLLSWAASGFSGELRIDTAVGQGGGANYIAYVMAASFAFVLHFAINEKGIRKKLAIFLLPLWLLTIIATGSRGGFLCLLGSSSFYLIFSRQFKVILGTIVLAIIIVFIAPSKYWERISTITTDPEKMDLSSLSRWHNIHVGKKIIMDYPLWGTGFGTFPDVAINYYPEDYIGKDLGYVAHNTYIQMGSELGIPFLSIFLLMNVYYFRKLILLRTKIKKINEEHDILLWINLGLLSVLPSLWFEMIKGDIILNDIFWWYYGLGFALFKFIKNNLMETQLKHNFS